MKAKEIQVFKEERHCLRFLSHKRPGTPGSPEGTLPRHTPSELRTTTANRFTNKFTHSTMDRPANQLELRVLSLYLPGG